MAADGGHSRADLTRVRGSDVTLSWHFLQCPAENECANGNHDCDVTEECDDTLLGFACRCRDGFVPRMSDSIVHS